MDLSQPSIAGSAELTPRIPTGAQGEEWLAEVQAVAASEVFHRSPRLRALLLFLVENTVTGTYEQLTEFEVGRHVFQRGTDWVPTDDSIVRSSVRQLRLKLAEFYGQQGGGRPWRIEIPRGSYVVSFRQAPGGQVEPPDTAVADPPTEPVRHRPRPRWTVLVLSSLLAVSLFLNAFLLTRGYSQGRALKMGLAGVLVMASNHQTRVVLDDYAHVLLGILRDSSHHITVEDYANRWYLTSEPTSFRDPKLLALWKLLTTRHIVSLGTVATLDRLLRTVPDPGRLVTVHARNITARDFHRGNSIVLGSKPNDPWVGVFEQDLNFRREDLGDGRVGFSNRNPQPGEQRLYSIGQNASINAGQGLAHVAYLSNGEGGFVLLVSGVNMVTAEAAGEFVTDPARLPELCRLFGVDSAARLPHLEILLSTTAVDNSVHTASILAWRRLD